MTENSWHWGGSIALLLLLAWGGSLVLLLGQSLADWSIEMILLAVFSRTFLHTGLFILAHEAMHFNLTPSHKLLNHTLGRLFVSLYAFLNYAQCQRNHGQHHKIPAQIGDPDFHDGVNSHPVWWYCQFLRGYLTLPQFGLFTLGWGSILAVCVGGLQITLLNLLLFWLLPLVLSSIQLFVFGTYFPHRDGSGTRSASPPSPNMSQFFGSLLSCYHFGSYHWEHHAYPTIPWYQLPYVMESANLPNRSEGIMRNL
jgi:beta-carotene/zeaxanthin 4-ketolase